MKEHQHIEWNEPWGRSIEWIVLYGLGIVRIMETALEARLSKARQIKQGMMQELLMGRVRLVGKS